MNNLTGKCLEEFLIFLVAHFRKHRPDYNKYSDEVIIAKFQRRHLLDQLGVVGLFLNIYEGINDDGLTAIEIMTSDIVDFNREFNEKNQ